MLLESFRALVNSHYYTNVFLIEKITLKFVSFNVFYPFLVFSFSFSNRRFHYVTKRRLISDQNHTSKPNVMVSFSCSHDGKIRSCTAQCNSLFNYFHDQLYIFLFIYMYRYISNFLLHFFYIHFCSELVAILPCFLTISVVILLPCFHNE